MNTARKGVRARRLAWMLAPAALLFNLGPAGAASASSFGQGRMIHFSHGNGTTSYSTNWSGYDKTGGSNTSVSADWTQPKVTCTSGNTYSAFWVGLDGDTSNTVEQTGTEADCSGSTPLYSAWYEMYPAYPVNFSNPVSPGDAFSGSVTTTGGGNFNLVLTDHTQNWTKSINASLSSAKLASAEVITEAPSSGSVLPLANFGTVNFNNVKGIGSSPDEIIMVSKSGTVEAQPSGYSGGSFSVTFKGSTTKHHGR